MRQLRVTIWCEGLDAAREPPRPRRAHPQGIEAVLARGPGAGDGFRRVPPTARASGLRPDRGRFWRRPTCWFGGATCLTGTCPTRRPAGWSSGCSTAWALLLRTRPWAPSPARTPAGPLRQRRQVPQVGERERVWVVDRSHPIVADLSREYFEVERSEMYGEPYGMPTPDELVAISW